MEPIFSRATLSPKRQNLHTAPNVGLTVPSAIHLDLDEVSNQSGPKGDFSVYRRLFPVA
jgi:hypothetical protein